MSRTALRSFIQRIHFYGGMFVGPFILVAALTGCLYAMAPTLEKVVYRDVMTVPAVEQPVSLEEQLQAAQHEHPDMPVSQVWPATSPTDSTRVLLSDDSIDESLQRTVFINPATAEVIGDYPTYSGLGEMPLRRWISSLHESFHLGKVGELYSELAASWLWVMACGGLYMWWIRRRPKKKATANATQQQTKRSDRWKATPTNTALPGTTAETHEHTGHEGHGASSSMSVAADAERVLTTGRAEGLTGPLRLYPPEDAHSAWQISERWVEWRHRRRHRPPAFLQPSAV